MKTCKYCNNEEALPGRAIGKTCMSERKKAYYRKACKRKNRLNRNVSICKSRVDEAIRKRLRDFYEPNNIISIAVGMA